jgi:hypothetical protein
MHLPRSACACLLACLTFQLSLGAAELVGTSVIPHTIEASMRYRRPRETNLAARVQLFVRGPATPHRFGDRTPAELLTSGEWAWHNLGIAVPAPAEALTVWEFNGKSSRWGVGQQFELKAEGLGRTNVPIAAPSAWISAATFLATDAGVQPDTVVLHVANESREELKLSSLRLWLPKEGSSWPVLWPQEPMAVSASVPAGDKGFIRVRGPRLPLTYAALELTTSAGPL